MLLCHSLRSMAASDGEVFVRPPWGPCVARVLKNEEDSCISLVSTPAGSLWVPTDHITPRESSELAAVGRAEAITPSTVASGSILSAESAKPVADVGKKAEIAPTTMAAVKSEEPPSTVPAGVPITARYLFIVHCTV